MAAGAADVIAAVRLAHDGGLGFGALATGHAVASPCDGGVLINTSRMRGVRVDPEAQTARVEAGALWRDGISEAQVFGLAGMLGSSSGVGVVSYTMGGGFGWLGRKYGFNAANVREADVVSADGELLRVSAYEHQDLFWGLKGGGGNFVGVVTSLEFALYPLTTVYGGNLFYPVERAPEVLDLYSRWVETLPDEMTTAVAFINFPPLPEVPEPLRGGKFVSVRGCYCGDSLEASEELLRPWREFGEPLVDTFRVMSYREMDMISMDPPDPLAFYTHVELLGELSPESINKLVEVAGVDSNSPLDSARAASPRRRPRASSRRPEPHRAPQLQVYYGRGRGYAYPRGSPGGPGAPGLRGRRDAPIRDRRHLRQLPRARRRDTGTGAGRLTRPKTGRGAPGRAQESLRPEQPLPLQPQHPTVLDVSGGSGRR